MRRVVPAFAFLILTSSLSAQPPARTHDVTPDDYASVATVAELAVSPDGKQVAYCLATWDVKADNRKTDLWVVDTDGKGKPRQLTKDRANDRHPKWSADGKAITVLGNRGGAKGKTQIWKVMVEGGEATAMTKVVGGITGYDYAPKADVLFYSVDAEATDEDDFSKLRAKFDKVEYGHGKRKVSEVYRIGKDDKAEKLIGEKRYVREFAVTQDGKRIAMITAFDDSVLKSEGESRVDIYEPDASATGFHIVTPPTDVYRKKAASPWAWLEGLAWSPTGNKFAFCAIFDGYPAEIVIGESKEGKWSTIFMPRSGAKDESHHIHGYGSPLKWMSNSKVTYLSDSRGCANVHAIDLSGGNDSFWYVGNGTYYGFDFAAPLRKLVGVEGFNDEFATLQYEGLKVALFDPNPHTKSWKLPIVSHITWKASDGTTVGGPLELPPGWKRGDKKLPLVVAIHGGPTTASHADLEFDPHNGRLYFSAAGYAVLCPNYRGSTGYGDKFVTDLIGRENDIEVKDILAGIQHLIDEGIADPDRIGVMGWSNGGYLTNCLISLKDSPIKFAAASSGAGIVDTVAEWGFNDEPAYPRVFKKGLPWETPEIYNKTSPTYQLGNVKTPTLIHVGGGDERCPPGHSKMLYRALKEYVNVPTQLVVYPGEPHGLTKLSNRKAKMEWDLAWFDKYLKK